MKQHKYIRLLGLILALGFVLSACGDKTASSMSEGDSTSATTQPQETAAAVVPQTTQSPQEQTGYGYEVSWSELSVEEGIPERLFYQGERLMVELSMEDGSRAVYDLSEEKLVEAEGLDGNVLAITSGAEGLWYCVEREDGLTLYALPETGGAATNTVDLDGSEGIYPYTMAVDSDGSFYLMGAGWLRVYNGQGKQVSEFSLGQEQGISLVDLSDGRVLLSTQTLQEDGGYTGAVKLLNTEAIGATLTEESHIYRAYVGWDGCALLSDGGSLYALDPESTTMSAVLDWIDTDVNPETLVSVAAQNQETIYLLSSTQDGVSLGTLTQVPVADTEQTVVTMGYCVEDPELVSVLNALTVEFNTSQKDVRIHLVNYGNYSDGKTRIAQDAGDLDLILTERENLAEVDLTDLNTLLDDAVGESTLMPCVYRALQEDGSAMPLYFTVETLLGSKGVLGEDAGWTPAEFAQIVAQYPETALLQYSNAYDALDLLVQWGGNYVTDFASLLQAVQAVPVDDGEIYNLTANLQEQAVPCLKDGSLLLEPVTIGGFSDLLVIDAAMEGDDVLKGFPTDTGNGGILNCSDGVFAIPSGSEHQEAAWEFMTQLLNNDTMTQYQTTHGFPVLEQAFSQAEQDAMAGLSYVDDSGESVSTGGTVLFDGESYEVSPLTQAQADEFRSYLDSLCGFPGNTQTLQEKARSALQSVIDSGVSPEDAASEIG